MTEPPETIIKFWDASAGRLVDDLYPTAIGDYRIVYTATEMTYLPTQERP